MPTDVDEINIPDSSVSRLAKISLRSQIYLVISFCFVLITLALCGWSIKQLVDSEILDISHYFKNLTRDLQTHDIFIRQISSRITNLSVADISEQPRAEHEIIENDFSHLLYDGHDKLSGINFIVSTDSSASYAAGKPPDKLISLASILAQLFKNNQTSWFKSGERIFIIDLDSKTSITLPCSAGDFNNFPGFGRDCASSSTYIRDIISKKYNDIKSDSTYWVRVPSEQGDSIDAPLIGLKSIIIPEFFQEKDSTSHRMIIASFVNPTLADDVGRIQKLSLFKELQFISPTGSKIASTPFFSDDLSPGLNLTRQGFIFKTDVVSGWTGLFRFEYSELIDTAEWPIGVFALILVVFIPGGILLMRWYSLTVVRPAEVTHAMTVESEEFNRAVVNAAEVAVCVLRRRDLRIVMQNRVAEEWGIEEETVAALEVAYQSEKNKPISDENHFDPTLTVEDRYLTFRRTTARYQGDAVALFTFSNATTHIQARQALEEAKHASDEANAAKTVFLTTMSHEIRTPLYGTLGTIELLGLTELDPKQRTYLQIIENSASTLLGVISDILDISKIESGQMALKMGELNPSTLTEEIIRSFSARAQSKGIQLYALIDSNVSRFIGDSQRIRQILGNLISNAIKFTEDGYIRISLSVTRAANEKPQLTWEVRDSGIGISENQLPMLFKPYFQSTQTQSAAPGTGLGLHICKRLCDMMSGTLSVSSKLEEGSSFVFALPLTDGWNETARRDEYSLNSAYLWIRAPIREWGANIRAYLQTFGARAEILDPASPPSLSTGILIDIFPERLPPIDWSGLRVVCSPDGPLIPQTIMSGYHVTCYAMSSILQGVQQALDHSQSESAATTFGSLAFLRTEGASSLRHNNTLAVGAQRLELRVLVVDDNPVNQGLLKRQLEALGCTVSTCGDGLQAIDFWKRHVFDVLLTDVNMPIMSGYELVKTLRAQGELAPMIGVTAGTSREQAEIGISMGMSAWIVKPVSLRELYDTLRRSCDSENAFDRHQRLLTTPDTDPISITDIDLPTSPDVISLFRSTMTRDIAATHKYLENCDVNELIALMHRMCGALLVVGNEQHASFCKTLENKLSADGLTPMLKHAIQSTLATLGESLNNI